MRGSLAIKTEQPRHHDWGQAAEDGGGDIVRKGDPLEKSKYTAYPGHGQARQRNASRWCGISIARIDPAGGKCPNEAFGAVYGIFRHIVRYLGSSSRETPCHRSPISKPGAGCAETTLGFRSLLLAMGDEGSSVSVAP